MEGQMLAVFGSTMMQRKHQLELRPVRWLGYSVACLTITAIPLAWFVFATDSHDPRRYPTATNFQFARLRYPGGIPDYVKNWYTDYPAMDNHLTTLLQRLTGIDPAPPVLVDPSSPDIFKYPLIYSVEPEQMILEAQDAANLAEYLSRGGFWFADDFHGDQEFSEFMDQLHRVLPEASPVELDVSHPLFHSFFKIDKIIQVTNDSIAKCAECDQWENGPSGKDPKVFAIFDQRGRISVLMAWNTDLGDGLEWADDPEYPANYSTYSFKFLTNVIVYAMSH
jgi:hypothetical protein